MLNLKKAFCLFFWGLFFTAFSNQAQDAIPDSLSPWVPWVLEGNEMYSCPFINNSDYHNSFNHICAWPSSLTIDVNETQGWFNQQWKVLQPSFVPLPGSLQHWPQSVQVNKQLAVVLNIDGLPFIQLEQGNYQISGRFIWSELPQSLVISPKFAAVNLTVNQQLVSFPKVENNELWLQQVQSETKTNDTLEMRVLRRINDGPYIELITSIKLTASGKIREEKLGSLLPQGFELIGIDSRLSTYVDGEGVLHAKVTPGEWQIEALAYAKPTRLTWQRPQPTYFWPEQEVWVFDFAPDFRIGKLEGARMIDSSQIDMPPSWYQLPSYLVSAQTRLQYDVQHRGKPLHLENQIELNRHLWLSFDQQSYAFSDHLSGKMSSEWRLSMQAPFTLESAQDKDGYSLITSIKDGERGVENRYPQVDIDATGSVLANTKMPITGWQHDFERVSIGLNLPPGNMLMAVFGADFVSKSWWSGWTIWTSFIVLLATMMATRLFHLAIGLCTALMLVCIYQEPNAPIISILNLLLAYAIFKHQPFTQLKSISKSYFIVSGLIAFAGILFFSAQQIKTVIYPQLEPQDRQVNNIVTVAHDDNNQIVRARKMRDELLSKSARRESQNRVEPEMIALPGEKLEYQNKQIMERYQKDALIQTGSGLPNWQWKQYTINWHSPVAQGQTFDLWLLSKNGYRVFKFVGISLTLLWFFLLIKREFHLALKPLVSKTASVVLYLALLVPAISSDAMAANFPEQALLEQLKSRLLKAPECAPNCAILNRMEIDIRKQKLSLTLEVHAANDTAFALPKADYWLAQTIELNNKPVTGLYKSNDWVYMHLAKGVSQLTLQGSIAPVDVFELEFNQPPKFVNYKVSEDWDIAGMKDHTLSGNVLQFMAKVSHKKAGEQIVSRYISSPFVQVRRTLTIDNEWRLVTEVTRIAPNIGALNVKVPTLVGENITSSKINVENANVLVSLSAGEKYFRWQSSLQPVPSLQLKAMPNQPFIEHWQVIVSPSWHLELAGVPMVLSQQNDQQYYVYSFFPYVDESLELTLTRPDAVPGSVLAIDSVQYKIEQGQRTSLLDLEFTYRSTRGQEHSIELPKGYDLKQIKVDNTPLNLQVEEGKLLMPIVPGSHNVAIQMRANKNSEVFLSAPKIDLNAPTSNITSVISVNSQRWILWTDGPLLGPAILYWGELLAFIVIALCIARVPFSPLNTVSWIVLGLGISLNNWGVLMLIALWFGALTASKWRPKELGYLSFNLSQLGLYVLSLLAIISLLSVIPYSLLSAPNMGVEGNNSYGNYLQWFIDQSSGQLPQVSVVSISTLFYKAIMLAWVIWLSFSMLNWIKWAWKVLGQQGYWRSKIKQSLEKAK
ncbi:hypothetical protein [Thalassotalea aquiviva]|uniref:hypothetical protein n=1 Tax=Thalassotalea aquiviva TaxID=3242415 RepID=UPI003529DFA5